MKALFAGYRPGIKIEGITDDFYEIHDSLGHVAGTVELPFGGLTPITITGISEPRDIGAGRFEFDLLDAAGDARGLATLRNDLAEKVRDPGFDLAAVLKLIRSEV